MPFDALATILGMAAITFAIRAGGLLLANQLPETGFIASWMKHVPGAVLASLVAPAIIAGGPAEALAAAAVAAIYIASRNLFAAMAGGVLAVFLARLALGGEPRRGLHERNRNGTGSGAPLWWNW